MPVTTGSQVAARNITRVTFILNVKSCPRFMRKLPLEVREMIYKHLLPGPRSIEVMFAPDARARSDPDNALKLTCKFVDANTTSDSQKILAALSQVNQETRNFVLRHYTHAFKTKQSAGTWFSFKWDTLAFTTLMTSRRLRHKFFKRKDIQADLAQVQEIAYIFENHYHELCRVLEGTPKARYFGTLFPNLENIIISVPLKHVEGCNQCNGTPPGNEYGEEADSVKTAKDNFTQLKKNLANASIEWNANCVYGTHCWKKYEWEPRSLVLDRPAECAKST